MVDGKHNLHQLRLLAKFMKAQDNIPRIKKAGQFSKHLVKVRSDFTFIKKGLHKIFF